MSKRWLKGMNECKSRELLVDQIMVVFWSNFFKSFTKIGASRREANLKLRTGKMWATKNASKEKAPFSLETIPLWDHSPIDCDSREKISPPCCLSETNYEWALLLANSSDHWEMWMWNMNCEHINVNRYGIRHRTYRHLSQLPQLLRLSINWK